ncbi:MAG: GNAT family N-acetyltransferase [Candidatus Baltobacteraceae bacterium]
MRFERAPTIETPRLRLRPHAAEDLDACAAMWADPRVTEYIGAPSTRLQSWARMRGYVGLWEFLGYGYWAIEERQSARYIGEIGFADFQREIAPSMQGVPEAGWALSADAHGKGYATEALRAATAWGDANLAAERTVCLISTQNLASIRVAEKCGYSRFDSATIGAAEALFFERYRPNGRR